MLERAARPTRRSGRLALGRCFWAAADIGGRAQRARHVAELEWWGAVNICTLARLGARRPGHSPYKQSVTKERLWKGSAPPNGSRLSCGRNARWRKAVEPQKTKAGQRGNAILPARAPASFKRWLGGIIPSRCLHGSRPPREHRAKEGQEHTTHRRGEPPGDQRPPLKRVRMGGGPSEKEPECNGGANPKHDE